MVRFSRNEKTLVVRGRVEKIVRYIAEIEASANSISLVLGDDGDRI
jgi:hypothetical protein